MQTYEIYDRQIMYEIYEVPSVKTLQVVAACVFQIAVGSIRLGFTQTNSTNRSRGSIGSLCHVIL